MGEVRKDQSDAAKARADPQHWKELEMERAKRGPTEGGAGEHYG